MQGNECIKQDFTEKNSIQRLVQVITAKCGLCKGEYAINCEIDTQDEEVRIDKVLKNEANLQKLLENHNLQFEKFRDETAQAALKVSEENQQYLIMIVQLEAKLKTTLGEIDRLQHMIEKCESVSALIHQSEDDEFIAPSFNK